MIEYINTRCSSWADWCLRRDDNGQGFPKQCVYTKLEGRGPGRGYDPSSDEMAWEIDRAVLALPEGLRRAVRVFYLERGTCEQKAVDCGCAPRTLFDRVDRAHVLIMDWLNVEAAGLPHDVPEKKM